MCVLLADDYPLGRQALIGIEMGFPGGDLDTASPLVARCRVPITPRPNPPRRASVHAARA